MTKKIQRTQKQLIAEIKKLKKGDFFLFKNGGVAIFDNLYCPKHSERKIILAESLADEYLEIDIKDFIKKIDIDMLKSRINKKFIKSLMERAAKTH